MSDFFTVVLSSISVASQVLCPVIVGHEMLTVHRQPANSKCENYVL